MATWRPHLITGASTQMPRTRRVLIWQARMAVRRTHVFQNRGVYQICLFTLKHKILRLEAFSAKQTRQAQKTAAPRNVSATNLGLLAWVLYSCGLVAHDFTVLIRLPRFFVAVVFFEVFRSDLDKCTFFAAAGSIFITCRGRNVRIADDCRQCSGLWFNNYNGLLI